MVRRRTGKRGWRDLASGWPARAGLRLAVLGILAAIGIVMTTATAIILRTGPGGMAARPASAVARARQAEGHPSAGARAGAGSRGRPAGDHVMAALRAAAVARSRAAAWIAGQVSADVIVACDPVMCSALAAAGVPAGRLLLLQPTAPDPLGSDVVVATPVIRAQFGSRLAGVYAPLVIASFGSGVSRIDVHVIAPDGAAAYEASLASDARARIVAGAQLLRNRAISVSAAARAALASGAVDTRLLATFAALAAQHQLRIVAFGDPSPGADPPAPLRGADIAVGTATHGNTGGLAAMLSFLHAQRPPFLPALARIVPAAGNQAVLRVEFAAPSPLGLLNGR